MVRRTVDVQTLSVFLFGRKEKPGKREYALDIDSVQHNIDGRSYPFRNPAYLTEGALLHTIQGVSAAANAIGSGLMRISSSELGKS